MPNILFQFMPLSNRQNYFSCNHICLGDIEARLPIDGSSTSDEDQKHGTNLVSGHLTISNYDLKSDIDIDDIDIEIVISANHLSNQRSGQVWPTLGQQGVGGRPGHNLKSNQVSNYGKQI